MGPFLPSLWALPRVSCAVFLASAVPPAFQGSHDLVPRRDSIPEASLATVGLPDGARIQLRIGGTVLLPDGKPARGAVVVSSAGGSAAVREDGSFSLALAVSPAAIAVELTAVANGPQGALTARRRVDGLRDAASLDGGTLLLVQSEGCAPDWIPTFGGMPGVENFEPVFDVVSFDDGAGPAVYVGGWFESAGGHLAEHVARWDGQGWSLKFRPRPEGVRRRSGGRSRALRGRLLPCPFPTYPA